MSESAELARCVRFRGKSWDSDEPAREWRLAAAVVTSITAAPVTTPLPGAPRFVAGLTSIDACIVPVFRLSDAPTRMLVCEYNESPLGLLVDAVTGIGAAPGDATSAPPELDLEALLRGAQRAMRRHHAGPENER